MRKQTAGNDSLAERTALTPESAAKGITLVERVARESEIKGRMKEIQTEIGSLFFHWPLGENPAEVKARIDSLINQYGAGSKANINNGRALGELAELEAQYAAKLQKAKEAASRKKQLDDEFAALQEELRGYTYTADVGEVMEHLSRIEGAAQVVASLKNTIAEQQAIVEANSGLTAAPLYKTHEDLLAERALGKDVAAELEKLESEIREQEAFLVEGGKAKESAERAIVGLKRKLVEGERALEALLDEKKDILCHFLIGQAEMIGGEYLSAAAELQGAYSRLVGLDQLIRSLRPDRASFAAGMHRIYIPPFQLKVFGGADNVFTGKGFDPGGAKLEEVALLTEVGITV
jgi:Chromosome segregation ATPases